MNLLFPALAAACIAGCTMPPEWALGCASILAAVARLGRRTILLAAAIALVVSAWDAAARDPLVGERPAGIVSLSGTVVESGNAPHAPFTLSGTRIGTLEVHTVNGPARAGEYVTVRGRLERLDRPANPGASSIAARLRAQGVSGIIDGRIVSRTRGGGAVAAIARMRAWVLERLAPLPQPAAALLDGALAGERGSLDEGVAQAFSQTGTTHVLVTAGLHLGAFAAMLLFILQALGAGRVAAALAALLGVALFIVLSGGHLPAVRAGVMVACALLARACGRAPLGAEAIALAAIVVTLWEPWAVRSASFALSFSCVIAIALFADPIAKRLDRWRLPHLLREGVALTLATQIGVWPLQAAFFLQLAPYAPLANALVVPMLPAALGAGMLTVADPIFAPLAAAACGWILGVVRLISALPFCHLVATPPPWWAIAAYDAAAAWLGLRRSRAALLGVAAASALCLWPPRLAESDALRLVALDVGQGQSIAVLSRGRAALIDGAPAPQGMRTLVPFLVRAGIHRVDALIVSHPHQDHLAGFSAVLRTLRVDRMVDAGWPARGAFGALVADAGSANVPIEHARAGARWEVGNAELSAVAPFQRPLHGTHDDVDNDSLIVRVRLGTCTVLVMGDAEAEEERALLEAYAPQELRADVLVAGHHGSRYSSSAAFLAAVQPRVAVISVARHNPYGLPSPQALERLRAAGARLFLTARDGGVDLRLFSSPAGCRIVLQHD
ncbi:MAG: DNA internalization-related competence protein ComEC/Rec2 [bacterium]|nr:DNA internalization-related competence protein ComEC/Rec2 [bacterium]